MGLTSGKIEQVEGENGEHVLLNVFVQDTHPVLAHVDTGSTSTLINLDYLKNRNLCGIVDFYKNEGPSFTVAHGGHSSFIGHVPRLSVKIADHVEVFVDAAVIPRAPYTLLLG